MQFMVLCFEKQGTSLLDFVYAFTKLIEIATVMDRNDNPTKSMSYTNRPMI